MLTFLLIFVIQISSAPSNEVPIYSGATTDAISITPDGSQVVIVHSQTIVEIYSVSSQPMGLPQTMTIDNPVHTAFLYRNGQRILIGTGLNIFIKHKVAGQWTIQQIFYFPFNTSVVSMSANEKYIFYGGFSGLMGILVWDQDTLGYQHHSTVSAEPAEMIDFAVAPDNSIVIAASIQKFEIFTLSNQMFQSLGIPWDQGFALKATELVVGKYIMSGGQSPLIICRIAPSFGIYQIIQTSFNSIVDISSGNESGILAVTGRGLDIIMYYEFNPNTSLFQNTFNRPISVNSAQLVKIKASSSGQQVIYAGSTSSYYINECPSYCFQCLDSSTCSDCNPGYTLTNNTCEPSTNVTANTTTYQNTPSKESPIYAGFNFFSGNFEMFSCVGGLSQQICVNSMSCSIECGICEDEKRNCSVCSSQLYQNQHNSGNCVIKQRFLQLANNFFKYASINVRCLKSTWLFLDGLWLYSFHKHNYTEFLNEVSATIILLQSQKDQIIEDLVPYVSNIQSKLPHFEQYSNPVYVQRARKDNLFFRNQLEFFLMGLPYSVAIFMIFHYCFRKIKESPVSRHLRIFSFYGFLIQMIIESNIEQYAFLCFRNFDILFSWNIKTKMLQACFVLTTFVIFFFVISSYYIYLYLYGPLSKYFLDNVFRVKGSFEFMFFIYGFRPFFKGVIHASLFENNTQQLFCLCGIEVLTCITITVLQAKLDLFKCKATMSFELMHYFFLALFNLCLWGGSLSTSIADPEVRKQFDQMTKVVFVLATVCNLMRSFTLLIDFIGIKDTPIIDIDKTQIKKNSRYVQVNFSDPHQQMIENKKDYIQVETYVNICETKSLFQKSVRSGSKKKIIEREMKDNEFLQNESASQKKDCIFENSNEQL